MLKSLSPLLLFFFLSFCFSFLPPYLWGQIYELIPALSIRGTRPEFNYYFWYIFTGVNKAHIWTWSKCIYYDYMLYKTVFIQQCLRIWLGMQEANIASTGTGFIWHGFECVTWILYLFHSIPMNISDVFTGARLPAGASGEGAEAVRPAHQQQGLPAVFYSHSGGPAWLLHEGPWQRGLTHHDSVAEQVGVCHWCPQTPAVWPYRPQPWEQEPPQAAATKVRTRPEKTCRV